MPAKKSAGKPDKGTFSSKEGMTPRLKAATKRADYTGRNTSSGVPILRPNRGGSGTQSRKRAPT